MTSSSRSKSNQSGPQGPIVLVRKPNRPEGFGSPLTEAPLPGRLLVALSRLHRAETAAKPPEKG